MTQPIDDTDIDHSVLDAVRQVMDGPLMDKMLEVLERTTSEVLTDLATALEANDLKRVQRLGHKLKGSAGNLGLIRIATLSARIESSGDIEQAKALVAQLPACTEAGLLALRKAVA